MPQFTRINADSITTQTLELKEQTAMQARVLRFTIKPERFEEARDAIEGGIAPALRAQPGFVRGAMLFDRSSGDAMTVVLWENEEAVRNWEQSDTMRTQLARTASLFTAPPVREVYEVGYRIPIEGSPTAGRTIETRMNLGAEDATVSAYSDIVEQSLKNQPGFSAALLLVDRSTGAGISVTAWDSEAAMLANESSGAVAGNVARFAEQFAEPPRVRSWELRSLR